MSSKERIMTPEQLSEIKARLLGVTPGEWDYGTAYGKIVYTKTPERIAGVCETLRESDAAFIAHAPEDIRALVAALEQSREREASLIAELVLPEVQLSLGGQNPISDLPNVL